MLRKGILLLFLTLALFACSDNAREKAAIQALENARKHEQLLPYEQVVALYQGVVETYPEMAQAEEAKAALQRLREAQQQKAFKRAGAEVLDRMTTVLSGYRAFSGKLPQSLADLDQDSYMFDSNYMAGILPEGAELYVALGATPEDTQLWLQQDGQAQVLWRTLTSQNLSYLSAEELKTLKTSWREVAKVGHLTQVKL